MPGPTPAMIASAFDVIVSFQFLEDDIEETPKFKDSGAYK